jgi:hypothetical protein
MKVRWLLGIALVGFSALPASAQISAYANFSASKLTGLVPAGGPATTVLYGPTIGLTGRVAGSGHLRLYGDLRGGFYGGSVRLDEVSLGPKVGLDFKKYETYGEFMLGFARYNNGQNALASSSTDAQIELNFGIDRRVTKRFDWRVFEYSYEQYYGQGGNYNPKTFSTGVVYHFGE